VKMNAMKVLYCDYIKSYVLDKHFYSTNFLSRCWRLILKKFLTILTFVINNTVHIEKKVST